MDRNISKPHSQENTSERKAKEYYLILHNDDINTFDHVINCLIDICNHDYVQAEQCATLTHYKGKCDIKKGEKKSLLKMKNCLSKKGLMVSLE